MIVFGWYMNVDVLILDKHRHAFCHLENSVCEPTPGDYKLRNPIEHAFIDWCIIKEVV